MWDIRISQSSDPCADEVEEIGEDHDDDEEQEIEEDYEDDERYSRDSYTAEWRNELIYQCQMRILGVITIGEEKRQNKVPEFPDETAFRSIVMKYFGLEVSSTSHNSQLDFW